jgi:hypothetical protein
MKVKGLLFMWLLVFSFVVPVNAAYHHEGEMDSPNFITAYPGVEGSKLDSCALCHTGGDYEKKPGKFVSVGSCQWCHMTYGYDGSGDIEATLNPYGEDYLNSGRSSGACSAIENNDSDGDGYSNIDEINALTYPGDPGDDPTKIPAPRVTYSLSDLESLDQHTQFMLMNTSRSGDSYAEYQGVTMLDLLRDAGMIEDTTTGVTVYAPDGFNYTYDLKPGGELYYIDGTYPQAQYYYDPEADQALGGWCDYSAPSCTGRNNGDPIYVDGGLQLLFAYKRDGAYLEPGILSEENKLEGEGPFRSVPPQMQPDPPDQLSTAENQDVVWPYVDEQDHNAGYSARTVVAIRIEPLPEGTTDFSWYEGGWDYVDNNEVIIYGNLASGGVQGTVTDQATGQPLEQATVSTTQGGYSTITDKTGSYSIAGIKTGNYTLRASAVGYQSSSTSLTITQDSTETVNFQLGAGSEVCPSEEILGNKPKELATLRTYRDTILLKSDLGKQYVKSYYDHAAEMVKIALTYGTIREKAVAALEAVKPSIDSVLEGNSLTLTKKQLSVIEKFTTALKEVVSPNLRKAICQFEKDINNKMVSKKFTAANLK